MLSPALQRVLPSLAKDGNERKFIETGVGEDGWVDSWGFSKELWGGTSARPDGSGCLATDPISGPISSSPSASLLHHMACEILIFRPGTEPGPSVVRMDLSSGWTMREFSNWNSLRAIPYPSFIYLFNYLYLCGLMDIYNPIPLLFILMLKLFQLFENYPLI